MNTFPLYSFKYIAQAYDCGTYGADAYNETICDTTQPQTGALANTGDSLWATLALGVILILIPIAYYVARRKKNKK